MKNKLFICMFFLLSIGSLSAQQPAEVTLAAGEVAKITENGKTLGINTSIDKCDPLTLATLVKEHPELRSLDITWKCPNGHRFTEEFSNPLLDVTTGWGSHIESLTVNLKVSNSRGFSEEHFMNWMAKLFPRINRLHYINDENFLSDLDVKYDCCFPELKTFRLTGHSCWKNHHYTVWIKNLLKCMGQLKKIHLDLWRWSPDHNFVRVLKNHVPDIEEVIISDEGILEGDDEFKEFYLESSYPKGFSPRSDYFNEWNGFTNLRLLYLGTFKEFPGNDLSLSLRLPNLNGLSINGLESFSFQDFSNLFIRLPECQMLCFGGARHRHLEYHSLSPEDKEINEIFEPHYCKMMMSPKFPIEISKNLERLRIEFATNINIQTLYPLLSALPNLTKLELQNCPEVSEEFLAKLEMLFPNLKIEHDLSLPIEVVDTFVVDFSDWC